MANPGLLQADPGRLDRMTAQEFVARGGIAEVVEEGGPRAAALVLDEVFGPKTQEERE